GLFDELQQRSSALADKGIKVVRAQRLYRDHMRSQEFIQTVGGNLLGLLDTRKVDAGGIATDKAVGACRQRRLVHHTVPLLLGELLLFTPGAGKDVVDVDGVVEVGIEINGRAADEIAATVFHEQRSQPFVRCSQAALQGKQPRRREIGIANRT